MSDNADDDTDAQQTMDKWEGGIPLGIPPAMQFDSPSDAYGHDPQVLGDELERYGITPEVVGKGPDDLAPRWFSNIYRYQFESEYLYQAGPEDGPTHVAPIQWRTTIYTIGHPSQTLMDFMVDHIHGRQKTLFDTGVYSNYFTHWAPFEGGRPNSPSYFENHEGPTRVGPDELEAALGVPFFELEIYDENDNMRGEARGYADPFRLVEGRTPAAPQEVAWHVGKTTGSAATPRYELKPRSAEERRLRGKNKMVFLNGEYIGRMQKAKNRGVYLRSEYKRPPTQDGFTKWDRQRFIDEGEFHPNAVRDGGKVWKVGETAETISLQATKPSGWDGVDEDDVDEGATGSTTYELVLTPDEPTEMQVRSDNKIYGALGKYDPPFTTNIIEETAFEVYDPASGTYIEK